MMKFIINSITKDGCRQGIIKELGCHGNLEIETPMCLLYTRAGAVPHLTGDLVENITQRPQCLQLSCATLVDQQDYLSQYSRGMAEFIGIPQCITYASVQDPAHPCPSGYNDKHSISVFTSAGRTKLDVALFMKLQEAIRPDWFEALCDGDTPPGTSMKRTKKAVDRTLTLLDQCLEAKGKSENLQRADILGVIEGGQISSERQRSARETALRPVAGFVLDALADQQMEDKWELVDIIMKELPELKPRILPGEGKPDDVLRAVESGVDIFDSTYPYLVTQRGCALVFSHESLNEKNASSESKPDEIKTQTSERVIPDGRGVENKTEEKEKIDRRYELDLSEKRFAEDFTPVFPGCSCYCCTNHTRAYINHLLTVNELLGKVLLMSHNCHHYFQFFHTVRTSLQDGSFRKLKEGIVSMR